MEVHPSPGNLLKNMYGWATHTTCHFRVGLGRTEIERVRSRYCKAPRELYYAPVTHPTTAVLQFLLKLPLHQTYFSTFLLCKWLQKPT